MRESKLFWSTSALLVALACNVSSTSDNAPRQLAAGTTPRQSQAEVPTAFDLMMLGTQDAEHGRLDAAIERFNAVLMMDAPSNYAAAACLMRGRVYQTKGDGERAMRDFEQAIRLQPDNALAYMYRGLVLSTRGEHTGAIQDFTEALRFHPQMYRARYNRAGEYMAVDDPPSARSDLDEALRLNPKYTLAYIRRGPLFARQRELTKASLDWQAAARLEPTLPAPWIGLIRQPY